MTEEKCKGCEWNYNDICICEGKKPCNVITTTQDTDYYYLGKIVNSAK